MAERIVIGLEWTPQPEVLANAFFTAAERIAHIEVPLRDTVELISQEYEANFAAEGRPDHWAPLAASTIRDRKARGYSPGPILTRTGALRDAATDPYAWNFAGQGQLAVATLSTPFYGRFHNTGFIGGWAHNQAVPARNWNYIAPGTEEAIDTIFVDWVMDPLAALPGT